LSSTAPAAVADSPPGRSWVASLFGDVRSGEGLTVLLMLSNLTLLLVGYYVVKTVREPLVLLTGGAEMKSYAAGGQALVLMGLVPLYGWLASQVDRIRLITWVLLVFVACLELFNLGLRLAVPYLGFVFFIWVGIFNLATIAQFWSFANDLYDREVGERLFPLIAIGATAGSLVGAVLASRLFSAGVSPANMLHITTIILVAHLGLYRLVQRREAHHRPSRAGTSPLGGAGGFELVFRSRYLLYLGVLFILLNVVKTIGDYVISRAAIQAAHAAAKANPHLDQGAFIGGFYADYFLWINVAAMAIQTFLVSRIVRVLGLGGALLALPVVSLGAFSIAGVGVAFAVLRSAKIVESATDYSVMNTARQLVWLPTRREEKYKAKQALDTFFVRVGDVVAAGLVFAGSAWWKWDVRGFAWANVVLVVGWLLVARVVLRENDRLVKKQEVP
jgi:AAA family ATP:ADP antiporter